MKPEYNNTLSDDDDLYIRININKESLKGNDNNYTSSNTNNNNMSYYSSALSLEKDLYSSSKNEFNLIESQINKIISSNQSFSSKISSSIPSKSVQSDDFKSKISKLSTDFLFNDEDDDVENDEDDNENENDNSEYDQTTNDDNENFVGIDLDSVISSDHSYLKTIKKLLKKSRKIRNKKNNDNNDEEEKEEEDDDEDDEDEDEEDENNDNNESEKEKEEEEYDDEDDENEEEEDEEEDEEEEDEKDESHHSYTDSQQMNFNSNLSLLTDSAHNSKSVKKKRVGNKSKKRKNNKFEKESTKSATSFGNQTYSQYSLSGLSSQSTIKSLIAKNKLLMEIEKLKELNSKLSKSSISNNNEPVTENALEISEMNDDEDENNDDEDENNNVFFSMAVDQITNLSSPRKSDYENDNDNDNITIREQIDNNIPAESEVSSSTIKKNEKKQLLEDLKSLSSLHHSIKSKSRAESPKRKAPSYNQDKISIHIIQDELEDKMTKGESDSEKLSKYVISSHNSAKKSINPSLAESNDVRSNKTKDNFSKTESTKSKLNKEKQKEFVASSINNNYSIKNDQKSNTYSENKIYSKSFNNTNSFNFNSLSNDRDSKSNLSNNNNLSSNKNREESHINDIKIEIKNNNPINTINSSSTTTSESGSDTTIDDRIFGNTSEKQQMEMEFSKKWKEVNDRLNAKNKSSDRSTNNQNFKSLNSHGIKKKYSNEIKDKLRKFSSRTSETASIIANSNVIYKNDGLSEKQSFTTNENKIKLEQLATQKNSNSPRSDGSITPRASLANIKVKNYSIPDTNSKIEVSPSSNINTTQINNSTTTEIPISQQPQQPSTQSQPQPIYSDKDTIDIYQTFKNEKPFINMRIKKQPLDSSIENNMISHSEIYSLLTSQLKDLSQQNKEKDDKIQNLYHQLQQEKRMTELLKSKVRKLRRENNRINERNHRNFQKFIIKSDEHLYNTEKEYLKRIRELELELYKERLNNKSANKASSNQIKKLNDELKSTNQEYQKNKEELNLKQNLQLDALYKEFAQLKKKINAERQERKDSDLDYIFKILIEKNTYTNDYIAKLMNKIK